MGLFAIAFASILAFGNNSNNISYEESFLWPYLVQYLEKKKQGKISYDTKKDQVAVKCFILSWSGIALARCSISTRKQAKK